MESHLKSWEIKKIRGNLLLCSRQLISIWRQFEFKFATMTTVAWPELALWKWSARLAGFALHVCHSVCACVCMSDTVGLEVAADCQSVESGRTYCQQLLSSADSSIYEYICICERVYMPANTHTEGDRQRRRQSKRQRQRHANGGTARCLHWKFKFFCY